MARMGDEPARLLREWLGRRLDAEAIGWLDGACGKIAGGAPERVFFVSFSGAVRRTGKDDLKLSPADLEAARSARPGWDPSGWSCDQAARAAVVLALPSSDADAWRGTLEKTFRNADLGEAVALYQTLPLMPHPEAFVASAAEGVRSNIRAVFEAIAHRNPYPAERFSPEAWNQMVLKALFIGSRLAPIQRLDERANPELMTMLIDYAHERWAAERPVSPELWRCVGPYADARAVADLEKVLRGGEEPERRAAALALAACSRPEARALLAAHQELDPGKLSWEDF